MGILQNSFLLRVVSALLLMPVVLYCLWAGGFAFISLLLLATLVSMREWVGMSRLSANMWRDLIIGGAYILISFFAFAAIRLHGEAGLWVAFALMLSVWASDSGAYFAGKTFKGPKMSPRISPNKTWSGFIGGCVFSAAAFYFFATCIGPAVAQAFEKTFSFAGIEHPVELLMIGGLVTVFGQAGDLLISMQKRKVGVKDTGVLIPGHGGILDRIDSVLMVSLVFAAYLFLVRGA